MKNKFLKMLLLAYPYVLSAVVASYANTSSVTEECQMVAGVAEYSCAAMVLLVLATCAVRGLRSAKGRHRGRAGEAGGKGKAADYRISLTTHPSSKKKDPLPENPTTHAPSEKETPVPASITESPARSAVDQQRRRQSEVLKNLDRLISMMSDDESDASSELLLTNPRCRVHSQDQALYSWSTSSTDSSVSVEETESRKSAEHSPRKGASDGLATPEKQDILVKGDDYGGTVKKRNSDDQKRDVVDIPSQTQSEEDDFAAMQNVVSSHPRTASDAAAHKGTSSQKVMDDVKAQPPESSRDMDKDTGRVFGEVQTGTSSQKVKVDVRAQPPESSRDMDNDTGRVFGEVQTGTSSQKETVDVRAQPPKSSRDIDKDTVPVFGEAGFARGRESSQVSGSEIEEVDNVAEWSCFLHNVPHQPKRTQVKTTSTLKPKSTRSRFAQLKEGAKDEVSPVTVYSKKEILSASNKGGRREPETERIKLNKAASSSNVHYISSSPEAGAMLPHDQYYEEFKNEMFPTTVESTNEASFKSNKDLSPGMTQRTQKFPDEWEVEPTEWDLLYSFPNPLRNSESTASKETDGCQSKADSYGDIGSSTMGSNSSFERIADFILSLKPYKRSSVVAERSQIKTVSQVDGSKRRDLENEQLLPTSTMNDVNKDPRARDPGNQYNTSSIYPHTTNDDGQNSSEQQRRDNHGTTTARQKSSSKSVQTSTDHVNYSEKQC